MFCIETHRLELFKCQAAVHVYRPTHTEEKLFVTAPASLSVCHALSSSTEHTRHCLSRRWSIVANSSVNATNFMPNIHPTSALGVFPGVPVRILECGSFVREQTRIVGYQAMNEFRRYCMCNLFARSYRTGRYVALMKESYFICLDSRTMNEQKWRSFCIAGFRSAFLIFRCKTSP